jgi:hypothetical protein
MTDNPSMTRMTNDQAPMTKALHLRARSVGHLDLVIGTFGGNDQAPMTKARYPHAASIGHLDLVIGTFT